MMSPRRHDRDAGGPEEVLQQKAELRDRIWTELEASGASRFPGARGRIPNFDGAEEAAELLRETEAWRQATVVKANPDSPQWPVRQRALEDGKLVYMAVPRLAEENPFFLLDPGDLEESPRSASSIKGASRNARTVPLDEMDPVDLVVTGSVGAAGDGARLGKGGGYSDLEFALGVEAGLLDPEIPVATTVHPIQLLPEDEIPMTGHDVPLDLIVTPEEVLTAEGRAGRPEGVRWGELTPEKIDSIPLLRRLREGREG